MTFPRTTILLAVLALSGCGSRSTAGPPSPLGRAFDAAPAPGSQTPAPTGDPPTERNGTISQSQSARQNKPTTGSTAPSPQAALRRYTLAYTNWQAAALPAHERALATLAIGPARLAAEQTAASQSAAATLAANHVQNKGIVLTIAQGQGPAHNEWVIVTQEQSTGTGPYAGLPPALHVILARVKRLSHSYTISEWTAKT